MTGTLRPFPMSEGQFLAMRRSSNSGWPRPIDREAPTIPPPSSEPDSLGGLEFAVTARPPPFRGFAPVSPVPRRLALNKRKR
jgi:hypothetical protein